MTLAHVLHALESQPWAILETKLQAILGVVEAHRLGAAPGAFEAAAPRIPTTEGGVAILPVYGIVAKRMNLMTQTSGGTSTDLLSAQFAAAVRDPNIRGIVLDVDSPGGTVAGVPELAREIRAARGAKRIVASVNALAASAAYWLASQADEVFVTVSGEVGSIGVLSVRPDTSEAEAREGIKYSVVRAGKYKAEGLPFTPPTDEETAYRQARADEYYGMFVADVAAGRGVATETVVDGYGEGRIVGAKDAVRLGMADRVGTLADAVRRAGQRMRAPTADRDRQLAMLAKTL